REPSLRPASACLLLLLLSPQPGAPTCPMLCTCYFSPPTVSCQANNFSAVPLLLPPDTQRLFLQNNLIRSLRPGTFGPGLLTLWLYSNNLSVIHPGTFRRLQALEELDLGDNRHLRSLDPDTFQGLERLQSLHLYRCQLSSLPSAIFRGLVSLQYLYLQENSLLYLQDDLFADLANLSHLFLHGNRLRLLAEHVFRGLASWTGCCCTGNRLQGVHRAAFRGLDPWPRCPGEALADLPSLEFLRLNANPWACDCRARPLWAWFQKARVSSSDVPCATPPERRGQDLRALREADFQACRPLPPRGPGAGPAGRAPTAQLFQPPVRAGRACRPRTPGTQGGDAPTEDDYWGGLRRGGPAAGGELPGPACPPPLDSQGSALALCRLY
uniref:Reticulon 4 receptor like 2 n=1 Tax=Ornithorhynchus anatinus TaxID=9258 RepID=K7EDZ9_ORNAN